MQKDFTVTADSSIAIITPNSDQAKAWWEEYVAEDAIQFGGGYGVELRYIRDICTGIIMEGMTIEKDGMNMALKDDELVLV